MKAAKRDLQVEETPPASALDRVVRRPQPHSQKVLPRFHWFILRTLLQKEILRHRANRGGIALALLLVVAALLSSFFGRSDAPAESLVAGVQHCFVDYWEEGPWIAHLRVHIPEELHRQILFRPAADVPTQGGIMVYPAGSGAIQIRPEPRADGDCHYKVWIWQPADGGGMAPFKEWFWRETHHYVQLRAAAALNPQARATLALPEIEEEQSVLAGGLDTRTGLATALVLFALFFVCVYLLPSLTCEERERGVLLAQALTRASPWEILAAKVLFYPTLGIALAALLAGIQSPATLTRPFFWLALGVSAVGSLGIGLTIASLARTQRTASMGALCYTMAVALLLFICQQNNIVVLPYIALEYYCPRVLHAALSGSVQPYHWGNLAGASILACVWLGVAACVFRRWGWQ